MNADRFAIELKSLRERCDAALVRLLGHGNSEFAPAAGPHLARLFEASAYSLTRGGKRVRPALVYGAALAVDPAVLEGEAVDYAACAAEMVHAYSLVHDDLPAMDDDSLRRGQPTCHVAFDEATAILVGDGLQARAFELLSDAPNVPADARLDLVRALAAASGTRGMVGGQAIDVAAVNASVNMEHLETMHALKTGALIRGSVSLGAILAGASAAQQSSLDDYGWAVGLAFQICDDILDATADDATLGKRAGADTARNKPNYVSHLGLDEARDKSAALLADALAALDSFDDGAWFLRDLTGYIADRARS